MDIQEEVFPLPGAVWMVRAACLGNKSFLKRCWMPRVLVLQHGNWVKQVTEVPPHFKHTLCLLTLLMFQLLLYYIVRWNFRWPMPMVEYFFKVSQNILALPLTHKTKLDCLCVANTFLTYSVHVCCSLVLPYANLPWACPAVYRSAVHSHMSLSASDALRLSFPGMTCHYE